MQLTPNYKLKKPEETDPIDILDLNDNTDIIDAELKKRPAASGGDISEMTVKTLEEAKTEFPVPVAGESTKTFLGKVKKFFEDTKNWMTGVCMLGQLVNNCVTNRSDLPLAAAQGKALMDLYTQLNSDITKLNNKNPSTYVLVERVSKAYSGSIVNQANVTISFPVPSKNGYTAKMILYAGNNAAARLICYENCKIISGTSAGLGIYNAGLDGIANPVTSATFYAIILYIKNTV